MNKMLRIIKLTATIKLKRCSQVVLNSNTPISIFKIIQKVRFHSFEMFGIKLLIFKKCF